MLFGPAPKIIQRTIDYLCLTGMAVALKMAVVLLRWAHRSDASKTDVTKKVILPT
jgi:hypothetical protein